MKMCECCGKKRVNMSNAKYCSACSVFTYYMRKRLSYYKNKVKRLNIKIYGMANGSERIR